MTIQEYFGDWYKVMDLGMVEKLSRELMASRLPVCPLPKDMFRAFSLCPLDSLKVVVLGQDPYSNLCQGLPVATGIAFGNDGKTPPSAYSPSLGVLMESVIDFTLPHGNVIFDPSLEKWERQGVLMLNSSLSCIAGRPGSHALMWRPFMRSLLSRLSSYDKGIVYVLMGSEAQSLTPYIDPLYNFILNEKHPSWYARNHVRMSSDIWRQINKLLTGLYGYGIEWYEEQVL